MLKRDELTDPDSCLSKAKDDEMLFVLLERDESAPATVRFWISERIKRGQNNPGDLKLLEAEAVASLMEARAKG